MRLQACVAVFARAGTAADIAAGKSDTLITENYYLENIIICIQIKDWLDEFEIYKSNTPFQFQQPHCALRMTFSFERKLGVQTLRRAARRLELLQLVRVRLLWIAMSYFKVDTQCRCVRMDIVGYVYRMPRDCDGQRKADFPRPARTILGISA